MRHLLLFFLFLSTVSVYGQKQKKEKSFLTNEQHWVIEIPLWIPGFRGELAYGDISVEGEDGILPIIPEDPTQLPEKDKGDIFSRLFSVNSTLRFFFIIRAAYQSEKFLLQVDGIGGSVGTSVVFNYNNKELVQTSINLDLARAYAGYEIFEKRTDSGKVRMQLYGIAGARFYIFKIHSSLNDPINNLDVNPVWVDPMIGLQFQLDLKNWQFIVGSDLGGFNINNRLSYTNQLTAYYRISRLISVRAGWFDIDIKHRSTILDKELRWQTHLSGPNLGIGFHF